MPPLKPDTRPSGAVHDNSLPQWAVDKMTCRRRRRYAFETIVPKKTALVVVDLMQSYIGNTPCAASIIVPISRLADCLRQAGGTVAWVCPAPMSPDNPMIATFWGREPGVARVPEMDGNGDDRILAAGLQPDSRDLKVHKTSYSAFFPGACPLPDMLRERGIDTVLIAGVHTNICCESSARDAFACGYQVIMIADATAARSDEEHRASLYNILRNFGDVRVSDDLMAMIELQRGDGGETVD